MLGVHDLLPHFTVSTVEGRRIVYGSLWQRKSLLLVCVPGRSPAAEAYRHALAAAFRDEAFGDAECVITADVIPGLTPPGAVVADRWREIFFVATETSVDQLPRVEELIDWVRHVRMHCPECEGEAR
jgi:hypothetical protein